jgi:hypothetical protein
MTMRRSKKRQLPFFLALIFSFILLPGISHLPGQSTDPAKTKKEKEKKKKYVVISDDDLKQFQPKKKKDSKSKKKTISKPLPNPKTKPKTTVKKKTDPKQTEKYWRNRKATLERQLKNAKEKLSKLEKELSIVLSQRQLKDPPPGYNAFEEYQKLLGSVKAYQRGVADLENRLENLWDEARKAGVPPGWLR